MECWFYCILYQDYYFITITMNLKFTTSILVLLIIFAISFSSFVVLLYLRDFSLGAQPKTGVTFSKSYAEYLGLDWRKTYLAILDELKVKNIRLAAPWNEIEPQIGAWNFGALDWQVAEATKREVAMTLVVGRRSPHWPECHDPAWIGGLAESAVTERQITMMQTVIQRYKQKKNIKIWQVENEPFLNVFGVCPPRNPDLLRREVALVKTLDARPVIITDSGELGLWIEPANIGDLFGTTLYRVTYNPLLGYFYYHVPPIFYTLKAWLVGRPRAEMFISELQAEAWTPTGILQTPVEEQLKSMDALRLVNHVQYAKRTGFRGAYLWGAEWWYWLKEKQNNGSLWRAAGTIFTE